MTDASKGIMMALRLEYLPEGPQFELFLFSFIGEEKNGMPLTVMSAFVRFGADPRREAARLAALPKAVAADALATVIRSLPEGRWKASETAQIASRLVQLLPPPPASIEAQEADDRARRRSRA